MANGEITHVELPSDDLDRAQRFYSELFGWEMQEAPEMPDWLVTDELEQADETLMRERGYGRVINVASTASPRRCSDVFAT